MTDLDHHTPDVWPSLLELDETAEWVTLDDGTETWRITATAEPTQGGDPAAFHGTVLPAASPPPDTLTIRWDDGLIERRELIDGTIIVTAGDPEDTP